MAPIHISYRSVESQYRFQSGKPHDLGPRGLQPPDPLGGKYPRLSMARIATRGFASRARTFNPKSSNCKNKWGCSVSAIPTRLGRSRFTARSWISVQQANSWAVSSTIEPHPQRRFVRVVKSGDPEFSPGTLGNAGGGRPPRSAIPGRCSKSPRARGDDEARYRARCREIR